MTLYRDKAFKNLVNNFLSISSGQKQLETFKQTAVALCDDIFEGIGAPYFYTDHSPHHSDRVLNYALDIANSIGKYALRVHEIEAMALACACYLHDLGMAYMRKELGEEENWSLNQLLDLRSWHVDAIEHLLSRQKGKYIDKLYQYKPIFEGVLAQLCRAHGTNSHKDACQKLLEMGYEDFRRGDLLGKILLLADELDLRSDRSRIEDPRFDEFPLLAKAHHFKHHYVVGVNVNLPLIRIMFAFPDGMPEEARNYFKEWTCKKLQTQIKFISANLSNDWRDLFRIEVRPEDDRGHISRKECTKDVCDLVQQLVKKQRQTFSVPEITALKQRPYHFYPEYIKIGMRRTGLLDTAISHLMDDFFWECNSSEALDHFDKIYITVPQNENVENALMDLLQRYSGKFKRQNILLSTQRPFVILGRTGAGKSTFLLHMKKDGRLHTHFSQNHEGIVFVHVDCLSLRSFERVIEEMLNGLVKECRKEDWIWSELEEGGWGQQLMPNRILLLSEENKLSLLHGILETLHKGVGTTIEKQVPAPVCFVLDNIDRMPGLELKSRIVAFATHETKSRGFPFFVITLRSEVKKKIEKKSDERPAIGTYRIVPPNYSDVLRARVEVAFSETVIKGVKSWCKRVPAETLLGQTKLKFTDLRNSLENAFKELTSSKTPFISLLAGTNIRNALVVCNG